MSQHHPHSKHEQKHPRHPTKLGIHRDWRFWVAVILMLAAMLAYVLSDDEAIVPGEPPGMPVPADAE